MEQTNRSEPKILPPKREPSIGMKGMKLFIEASAACPNSITAQAAIIAARCKKVDDNPLELLAALQNEPELVQKVVTIAQKVHEKKGVRDLKVDTNFARRIIDADFRRAVEMLSLDQEALEQIYIRNYQTYERWSTGEKDSGKFEKWMRDEAADLLQQAREKAQ